LDYFSPKVKPLGDMLRLIVLFSTESALFSRIFTA
jgi:hypothetical protein